MPQRSKVSKIALWRCSLNVFVIAIVFVIVFVFVVVFLVRSCFFHHWSNASKVKSLKDRSLKVFSNCICHCHCLCRCLFVGHFMFSYHPVLKVKSFKDHSLKAFSKCHCLCLCLCICLVVVFLLVRSCFFMTPISFTRFGFALEGFESNTMNETVND